MTAMIDAHQHYWHIGRGDYDWMPPDDPILARPYGPADLAPSLEKHGIAATVLVQAAATVEETRSPPWLAGWTSSGRSIDAIWNAWPSIPSSSACAR